MDDYRVEREQMVSHQIAARGIEDDNILAAMRSVPRHLFLPFEARGVAYGDHPVRIGNNQTISQPYIVALMTSLLEVEPEHKVLDVGTGSGYQAAILAELAADVYTIERFPDLAESAKELLENLGHQNIHVLVGDGTQGYVSEAPYDRIVVTAAAPRVPEKLLSQLAEDGLLVIPVGGRHMQHLEIWHRKKEKFQKKVSISVVFVPLVGEEGWQD
jgi:protein-L-isoaspartate(D-aspartate) O-methyltransferase